MDSISDPPNLDPNPPKRNRIDRHRVESSSSSSGNEELDPLLIANFPNELIVEILLRLPAKSLGKFKCVSRSWRSLISSQGFVKSHLAIASGRKDFTHHGLIFTVLPPNSHSHLKQCSVSSVLNAPTTATTEVIDIDYPMKHPNKSFWVVGSSNGLVCFSVEEKDLFLWNPCIKKSEKLPDMGIERKHGCFRMFGFGYDDSCDDYKVVGIFCSFCKGVPYEAQVKMYSLKKNAWSRIQDFKAGIPLIDSGKVAGGKLHWAASHGVNNWKIVSLDLADETYGEIERPTNEHSIFDWTLGELGGCLSVLYDYEGRCADVWVMNDYGVKDSWVKFVSVPYMDYPRKLGYSSPICLLTNDEILLAFCSFLVLYNPKSNTIRRFPRINYLADVSMYVESLVSPSVHEGEQRQLQ